MEKLYEKAIEAYNNSYSPYSRFAVGVALLMKDGKIINGANVENASFGLSNCAERSALFAAYSLGYKKADIKKMLILANTSGPISPCGACRQVISELVEEDMPIVLSNLKKEERIVYAKDLLPFAFTSKDL